MYPTVHNYKANDLTTQGFGALADAIECIVTEELNGAFTLELRYPLNGQHASHLTTGNIIMAKPSHNQNSQAFRISQVKKTIANSITVYANHISYDMSGYSLRAAYSYNSLSDVIAGMNGFSWSSNSKYYHHFEFATDMTSSARFSMPAIQTLRAWMGGQEGSILDVYGGEWIYDNFTCFLTSRRGTDTGYRISYGKNLAEYENQRDYNKYSHICAYWKKSEAVVAGSLVPTYMVSPFRVAYYDASKDFENQPTVAQLDNVASNQIERMSLDAQTITVTPAQIGNNIIGLGDSVLICYENVFQTRVIKTVWDVLGGVYKSLVLGTKQVSITDTIKSLTTAPSGESGTITPADYVVECVSNQLNGYTKWASGKLESWQRLTITLNATTVWTNPIYYGSYAGVTYNATYIDYPVVNITAQSNNGYVWLVPNYSDYSINSTGTLYFYSVGSHSNVAVTLNVQCVGRWK